LDADRREEAFALRDEVADLQRRIVAHPGTVAHNRWQALRRTVAIFGNNMVQLQETLDLPATDQLLAIELVQEGPRAARAEWFDEELDRTFHNFVAGAATLIDHARRLVGPYQGTAFFEEYERRRMAVAGEPVAFVVKDLRNYFLHVAVPRLGYKVSWEAGTPLATEIRISCDALLEWKGWKPTARRFLDDHRPTIELRGIVSEYGRLMGDLYAWLLLKFLGLHGDDLAEANGLIAQQRELLGLPD
jgi:hypothetical protein